MPKAVPGQPLEPGEVQLRDWWRQQAFASPATLEEAARTLLGLTTALLGLLFGVLTVASDKPPAYLALPAVQGLGVVVVATQLVALIAALGVLLPRWWEVPAARLDEQEATFRRLLGRKARWLTTAVLAFGIGIIALAAILVVALVWR